MLVLDPTCIFGDVSRVKYCMFHSQAFGVLSFLLVYPLYNPLKGIYKGGP